MSPVIVNNTSLQTRSGYYVKVTDDHGRCGFGEIAPLPGLSTETLDDVPHLIQRISTISIDIDMTPKDLMNGVLAPITSNYVPSVQFGIESAILSYLDPNSNSNISYHGLISDVVSSSKNTNYLSRFKRLSCLKIKVGRSQWDDEIAALKIISQALPNVSFRLDANQRFSLSEACDFFSHFPTSLINYVESPCHDINDYDLFFKKTGHAYAVDTPELHASTFNLNHIPTIIVKPTLLGSFESINKLKQKHPNTRIILSSSYETIIGLNSIAHLASYISLNEFHGIGTFNIFSDTPDIKYGNWNLLSSAFIDSYI